MNLMSADPESPALRLPASVHIGNGGGGLRRVDVQTVSASAALYLQGAHLTAWQPSHAAAPPLWVSKQSLFASGKAMRGGIPICFPWFGPHATNQFAPAHGFARIVEWTLVEATELPDGTVALALSLADGGAHSAHWPHAFRATYRVRIGRTLRLELEIRNTGSQAFAFEEALHSYFGVANVEHVTLGGLQRTAYLDKVKGFASAVQDQPHLSFHGETDRVYLDTPSTCVIRDPDLHRRITIEKSNSTSTIVWNPGPDRARALEDFGDEEWLRMLCVETGNVRGAAVRLEPGGDHTLTAEISVERE
jgi:glucose-6-phosphate 1-epimerase